VAEAAAAGATRQVLVTGATGYLARPLVQSLTERGHRVRALVRRAPAGFPSVVVEVGGDALDGASVAAAARGADTIVHLVGTPRPSPRKGAQFRAVDLVSIQATVHAARAAAVGHVVYVSVAHPAPIMRDYIAARRAGEALLRESGVPATILRPWYVLGPGHRWPHLLVPLYALARLFPATRAGAARLGLVTRTQMVAALARAVEDPPSAVRVVDVASIRAAERAINRPAAPAV
jgi:uncharacterized protein YbjT (DUF2867 family)